MTYYEIKTALQIELVKAEKRIVRIRKILDSRKPEDDRDIWNQLIKRRTSWEVHRTNVLSLLNHWPVGGVLYNTEEI